MPFAAHVELLRLFLSRRTDVVETLQSALNAQRKPSGHLTNHALLFQLVEDSFYAVRGVTHGQLRLRGQLEEAHWASGFRPRQMPGLHNGLIDPAEMMIRAFHLWRDTNWPGRNGRVRYAHTLFNLFEVRCLELLSMRVWDEGPERSGERLGAIQELLDELWAATPPDQPTLVRDARWLIPLAQSPATDDLAAYFEVAEHIEALPSDADRLAIHKASVLMAAGHLRSQTRHLATKTAVGLDDAGLMQSTRASNALDFALLVGDLVPLLAAYERACQGDDRQARLGLADTICQGVSADPDLFLNRIDLLGVHSTIDHLYVTVDALGHATHTPTGRRHAQLMEEYGALMNRASTWLREDYAHFRPVAGAYSAYGALYGFSSNLIEHMALKLAQAEAMPRYGLEDVFVGETEDRGKLAWVNGWRKLPHLTPEVQALFHYPQEFAEAMFNRLEHALRASES